jgi:hypothetical protein
MGPIRRFTDQILAAELQNGPGPVAKHFSALATRQTGPPIVVKRATPAPSTGAGEALMTMSKPKMKQTKTKKGSRNDNTTQIQTSASERKQGI